MRSFDPSDGVSETTDELRRQTVREVRHILADSDANENNNRVRAVARHVARFVQQLAISSAVIAFVALSSPVRHAIANHYLRTSQPLASLNSIVAAAGNLVFWVVPLVLPVVYVGYIAWLNWYWWRRREMWQHAKLQAGGRSPDEPPRGYLSTFLIYTQTKNAALYSRLFGLAMIYSATLGLAYGLKGEVGEANGYALFFALGLPAIEIVLALIVIAVGFGLGRDFVPGPVMVKNTIVMGFLATTSNTDYTVAQNHAQPLLEELRNERPWSFYSFGRKRKNDSQ